MQFLTEYPDGMTIAELKRFIADWPEINRYGKPTRVWVGDNNLATEASPLNLRQLDDGSMCADLILLSTEQGD